MRLVLEYGNTRKDFLTQDRVMQQAAFRKAQSAHHEQLVFWSAILLLAIYVAIRAEFYFVACVFGVVWGGLLVRGVSFARTYWQAVEQSYDVRAETRVRLEVAEDGLRETLEGIQSFVPWSSVHGFRVVDSVLLVELAAGLRAIIPQESLSPGSASLAEVIAVLREKGVSELPQQC